jgi:hypothetical protein
LTTFSGSIEEWGHFHNVFVANVDRNENLSAVRKFQYLKAAVTGKAAQSIQMLEVTGANYPIPFNILKERFDYHRRVCMRHWHLIKKYPKIREETSEAIEDILDTFKVNLEALAKIGEPITSNIVIIDLLSSKLPSSLIRKWQRTVPDKRMIAYTHLMDFLQTRANSDDIRPRSHKTKGSSHKSSRHRRHQPRGQAFHITSKTLKCPACQGPHEIKHCKIFKGKSATKRFELPKRSSLCTN